jgi:hypothetical protein
LETNFLSLLPPTSLFFHNCPLVDCFPVASPALPCNLCLGKGHFLRVITAGQPQKKKGTLPLARIESPGSPLISWQTSRHSETTSPGPDDLSSPSYVAHAPNVGILLEDNGALSQGDKDTPKDRTPVPKAGTRRHLTRGLPASTRFELSQTFVEANRGTENEHQSHVSFNDFGQPISTFTSLNFDPPNVTTHEHRNSDTYSSLTAPSPAGDSVPQGLHDRHHGGPIHRSADAGLVA